MAYIPDSERDLVFFDIETTGLNEEVHTIIEVAAVRLTPDCSKVIDVYEAKIMPTAMDLGVAETRALEVNRFSLEEWEREQARHITDVLPELNVVAKDGIIAGQNVGNFDMRFWKAMARRHKIPMPDMSYRVVDIDAIAWPLLKAKKIPNVKLETLCRHFKISNDGSHRALTDVKRTIEVYRRLIALFNGNMSAA